MVREALGKLGHRGPDQSSIWELDDVSIGFVRLQITGSLEEGNQPQIYQNKTIATNGEIYNSERLMQQYHLPKSVCDTDVILPLYHQIGEGIVNELDGFYSSIIFDQVEGTVTCLRDHIGKKPLFAGKALDHVFVVSELKAFDSVDSFEEVPLGVSDVDLKNGTTHQKTTVPSLTTKRSLQEIFVDAVEKRIPPFGQPFGVFLSGGLDSSLVASIVSRSRPDAVYFTLSGEINQDGKSVEEVVSFLGLKNICSVPIPNAEELAALIPAVVQATESFNPSIVSNGLGTFLLAEAARKEGIKVVLGGEGADELFGGYHSFNSACDPWKSTRTRLIEDMHRTELRRLDLASMANSIEVRCPFLDREMRAFSDMLSHEEMYNTSGNKYVLRTSFVGFLPNSILMRKKTSLDVGSGIRPLVVSYLRRGGENEREVLRQLWLNRFNYDSTHPYFSEYPVFDHLIDRRRGEHS
jgi:asparagine synthase (glutamine-hydrolysing)